MSVLILKNYPSEGPGTIAEFLRDSHIPYRAADLSSEAIPSARDTETLVILGGPMSVNEADIYPYIHDEIRLVQDFIGRGRQVFGVCLGAQIMAKALGSEVYAGPQKEIGWHDVELAEKGPGDPCMAMLAAHPGTGDFSQKFRVFHWHGETFHIPAGAERLAKSALYPNQAFRYGSRAYAFQFHIEVTKEMIYDWLGSEPVDMEKIRQETETWYDECRARALKFYQSFFLRAGKHSRC